MNKYRIKIITGSGSITGDYKADSPSQAKERARRELERKGWTEQTHPQTQAHAFRIDTIEELK